MQALYRLHLPVVRAVKIRLRRPDMGMAHQDLDGFEIVSIVQEGRGEDVPHDVRMNPFLD